MIARVLVVMAVVIGAMLGPAPHGRAASSTLCTAHQTGYMKVVPSSNNGNPLLFSQLEVCFGEIGEQFGQSSQSDKISYNITVNPSVRTGTQWVRVDIVIYRAANQTRLTGGALTWIYDVGKSIDAACGGCPHTLSKPPRPGPPPYYMGISFAPVTDGVATGSVTVKLVRQESLLMAEMQLAATTASMQRAL